MATKLAAPLTVAVVGQGRVGTWLVHNFRQAGIQTIALRGRARQTSPITADICLFTVPERAVRATAERTVERLTRLDTVLCHCAGAVGTELFGTLASQWACGTLHPLYAIAGSKSSSEGVPFAVAGDARTQRLLKSLIRRLGGKTIAPKDRALYHASAVMAAGLSVIWLDAAIQCFKMSSSVTHAQASAMLLGLHNSALQAYQQRGLRRGLTGPFVRGDLHTMALHLKALSPQLQRAYRAILKIYQDEQTRMGRPSRSARG